MSAQHIMDDAEIAATVLDIVGNVTGKKILDNKADLSSEGIDSMTMLDILTALEERFDIELNESSIQEFVTIDRMAKVVRDAVQSASKPNH